MKRYLTVLFLAMVAILLIAVTGTLAEVVDVTPTQPGIDLTPLFQALLAFLAALITYKLIPWIQARTTAQQQEMLRAAVSVAVYAAEQLYGTGKGKEKLMYVKGQLTKKGFHVDIDEIEAAVKELSLSQGQSNDRNAEDLVLDDDDECVGLTN